MPALIYLDVDDEITSAAARIRAVEARRIGLVLPLGSRLATSRINFRLLAREAEARGKQLEVITNDASARALAASAGIATHLSVAAFEGGPGAAGGLGGPGAPGRSMGPDRPDPAAQGARGWPGPARPGEAPTASADDTPTISMPAIRRPAPVPTVPQVGRRPRSGAGGLTSRRLAAILAVVVVLVGTATAGFLLLPSAAITLVPASSSIGPLHLSVTAQPGITKPDPVNLLVPATTYPFDVQASDTFPSTGVKVAETAATGEVTFSSLNTGGSNTIASGSIVKTQGGVEFRTTASVHLPAAQIGIVDGKFVIIPSTRKVGVEAVEPGVSGNVAAGEIVVVPAGENAARTIVKNDQATSGGTHTETKRVAKADIDAALAALRARLGADFDDQIGAAKGIPPGTTLFTETKALGDPSFSPDPTTLLGTAVDTFDLAATAKGTIVGVDPAPVSVLADARLRTAVGAGYTMVEASIDLKVGAPIVAGSSITFPVTASATRLREVDRTSLRARIRGLGLPQARTLLGEYGDVTITVWPDWVTTIPSNDGRVTFTVAAPSAGSPATPAATQGGAP